MASTERAFGPVTPVGINHVVLNVRDLEESHRFWTEVVGLKQVGELRRTEERPDNMRMRFYSGVREGRPNHHDVALVEVPDLPEPPGEWGMSGRSRLAVNHIAIAWPDRESWLAHLRYLQAKGVPFKRRVNHGMTHSLYLVDPNGYGVELLYELPREIWEGDIDAALNYIEVLPTEGEEALADEAEHLPTFGSP